MNIIHSDPKISILLVDDSKLVLNFATVVLKGVKANLLTAQNGRVALDIMQTKPADMVITDLMMPEMDGFDLIGALRADDRFRQTYIIVMTALDKVNDKVRALDLGANDYAVKPLDANEFKARVQNGLREIHLKKQLNMALESLDRELRLVANVQRRLLPKTLPQGPKFQSAATYIPWSRAGGDYYDCFTDARGRLVLTIADVSGHGASAAVLMAVFRALLKNLVAEGDTAAEVIERLNQAMMENIGDHPDFVTVFLGLMDQDCTLLNYCSAGHGDMMLLGPEAGHLLRLGSGGTVLGCFRGTWQEEFLPILPGQTLILYTDGLIEAVNSNGEEFGRQRLEDFLLGVNTGLGPDVLNQMIRAEVETFAEGTLFADDVTLFFLKFQ